MFLFVVTTEEPQHEQPMKPTFAIEIKGAPNCASGSMITDKMMCNDACSKLGVGPVSNLKDGHPCYKAGNGKCRQDGKQGKEAALICSTSTNLSILKMLLKNKITKISTNKFFHTLNILVPEAKCADQERWCSEVVVDKTVDCCATRVQQKCPMQCDTCPGVEQIRYYLRQFSIWIFLQ